MELLQVQPELRACAEPVPEPQGGVGADGALAAEDAGDPVGRHLALPGQLGGG
jgi:hypothetical protein